VLTARVDG